MRRATWSIGLAVLACLPHIPGRAQSEGSRDRAAALIARGDAYAATGDRGTAIAFFRDAIDADPRAIGAYLRLGEAYRARRALGDARIALEAGLARDPSAADLWLALAQTLLDAEAPAEAARALRTLLLHAPLHPEALTRTAELAAARGAWTEALAARRALVTIGTDAEARRYEAALELLAAPLDPIRAPRTCEGSAIRRALASCGIAR